MSDTGYLTERREDLIAKILDSAIDFNDILKSQKKVFGIFSLGKFMERNDRKIFKSMLAILDDKVIGKNPNQEVKDIIDKTLSFLENKDFIGFDNHVAGVLEGVIETPFPLIEKQLFISVITMFNGLINKAIVKIEKLITEAEAEV